MRSDRVGDVRVAGGDGPGGLEAGGMTVGRGRGLLGNLLELSVRSPANRIGRRFPLDLRLEVDEHHLHVHPRPGLLRRIVETLQRPEQVEPEPLRLVVRLRHCYVRCECDGVVVVPETKYRAAIDVGGYREERTSTRSVAERSSGEHGSRVGLRFDRTGLSGGIGISAAGSSEASADRRTEQVVSVSTDMYEVEVVPGGWRVGDRVHGDPLKRGGHLDGLYFGRRDDRHPHTCEVEFLPGSERARMLFRVTSRDGLVVERVGGGAASVEERSSADDAMRDRLAALRLEREFEDVPWSADGETTLFALRVECRADATGDDHDGEGR